MTDTLTDEQQVEIAANFLDEHYPGWAERVPIDTFQLWDSDNCIGYWADDKHDDESWDRVADELGGIATIADVSGELLADNTRYRDLWVAEIAKRKEAS